MYIRRDYDVHRESAHTERLTMDKQRVYMQRDTTVYIQRHYYVHTESIQSVHLEELLCTYSEDYYVHTIVERWIMYIQERLWQCTLRSGVTDYALSLTTLYDIIFPVTMINTLDVEELNIKL
jgi:hypothetical protein